MKRPTIFVVDDDDSNREVLGILLEEQGYNIISISQSEEVFRLLHEVKPALILLDIWIEGVESVFIIKRLKTSHETKDIPVVLVSARHDVKEVAERSGADGYLAKPFEFNNLIPLVRKFATP